MSELASVAEHTVPDGREGEGRAGVEKQLRPTYLVEND